MAGRNRHERRRARRVADARPAARPHHADLDPAGRAARDDRLHADPDRARLRAERARHADDAAEPGAGRDRVLPLLVRDEPDADEGQRRGDQALPRRQDQPGGRDRARPRADADVHVQADANVRPRALREARPRAPTEDARRRQDPGPDPGLHHLRAEDGLSDRVPDLPAVPDHRHGRRRHAHVDGDDDAAACPHLPAVQDPAVRARRRLAPGDRVADEVVQRVNQDTVTELAVQAMTVALKVSAPFLLVGLVIGLLISIFQAATQIQEVTLTFVPKIVAVGVVVVLAGPWMLDQLIVYTDDLYRSIPTLAGP